MVQAVNRAIRANGCYNCRLSLLRALTTICIIPSKPAYQPSIGLHKSNKKQAWHFSSFAQQATISPSIAEDKRIPLKENEISEDDLKTGFVQNASVPWYLQVESPSKPLRPLSERQRIPDLPESPPEILEPLLQQISVDLGLDDLSLLDLRFLDPPPALGANLLMIIGTARSEKHLHVSADRLCRWLRSEYKLRPDADGLLGRNELKLKIRRKNRRAKLLGSGTSIDEVDDGVRTGWVCINIGIVESSTTLKGLQPPKEGFIGFGRRTEGVRIVVQMLVEERREELDLEKLWEGIAKRSIANSELVEEIPSVVKGLSNAVRNISTASISQGPTPIQSSAAFSPISVQSRGFHTAPRKFLQVLEQTSSTRPQDESIFSPHNQPGYVDLAAIHAQTISLLESGEHESVLRLITAHISSVVEFQNDGWRKYLLEWLKRYMENIPRDRALWELGSAPEDHSSTSFLRCFYRTISRFPSESEWELQIWLHCFARRLGHPGYTLERFSILFNDLQLSGITISDAMYVNFLRSALQPDLYSPAYDRPLADNAQREFAVKILQDMYDRTGNILIEDVFLVLQESLASYPTDQTEPLGRLLIHRDDQVATYDLPVSETQVADTNSRMNSLMSILQVRVLNDQNRMDLMILYAKQHKWVEFWRLWRSIAREEEPRSPALWALMFKLVAETTHQKGCMTVLRTWMSDMEREEPQVRLEGEVLEGVTACLAVADPSMKKEMLNDPEAKGEWINLWRRCLGIM